MKTRIILLAMLLSISVISGCGIFGGGCKCPKVSYQSYPHK